MPLFRCLIRGENFPSIVGTEGLAGFYTTRWVEALSTEEAEQVGLEALRGEVEFSEDQKRNAPDAKVYFEEIAEVPEDTPRVPNKGATWFPMDED